MFRRSSIMQGGLVKRELGCCGVVSLLFNHFIQTALVIEFKAGAHHVFRDLRFSCRVCEFLKGM